MQDVKFNENILPEINRAGVGLILISEWPVDGNEEQKNLSDAAMRAWKQFPHPEGLLSYSYYLGTKGNNVLFYSQWKSDESYQQFLTKDMLIHKESIDTLQIKVKMVDKFRLRRSAISENSTPPECIVIVRREYGNPEIISKFIDAAYNAVKADGLVGTGCVSAHFHISINSGVMVNYAEWISEQAYQEFVGQSNKNTFNGLSPLWKEVREFPYKPITGSFEKYRFYRSIVKF